MWESKSYNNTGIMGDEHTVVKIHLEWDNYSSWLDAHGEFHEQFYHKCWIWRKRWHPAYMLNISQAIIDTIKQHQEDWPYDALILNGEIVQMGLFPPAIIQKILNTKSLWKKDLDGFSMD